MSKKGDGWIYENHFLEIVTAARFHHAGKERADSDGFFIDNHNNFAAGNIWTD